ncbi:MAG: preprotein translocase subunit SecE [Coxiella sp. RIFCSPHIGHO2_12_FULL_42_15]|nr:MAG: preprotein translocase subunit SecE [Coxiella sp. RIFCSPHIGHO2_12_FULL_42_15]
MSAKSNRTQQQGAHRLDWLKWLMVAVIVVAGIIANFHYSEVAWAIRAAIGIVVLAVLTFMALQTANGLKAWSFIKGARSELKKVVWPTRQETVQTTIIVVIMVIITALVLWGLDTLFMGLIGWLTGQRG